jgi:hypothetical protein
MALGRSECSSEGALTPIDINVSSVCEEVCLILESSPSYHLTFAQHFRFWKRKLRRVSNPQNFDIFRRHITDLQSLYDLATDNNAGYIINSAIDDEEESRDLIGTLIEQNTSTHATIDTVSAQIMYDAAQEDYAASLCAYTPSSIESSEETPRTLSVSREILTDESVRENCVSSVSQQSLTTETIVALNQTELTATTGTVSLSKGPTQFRIPPNTRSRQGATANDKAHLKTVPRASDDLTSEGGLEEEQDDDNDNDDANKEDQDFEHDNSEGRSAALVFKGPEILGNMWDKASRAGRLDVIREVLYDTIITLRARGDQEMPNLTQEWQGRGSRYFEDTLLSRPALTSKFRHLKRFLEVTDAGEHISKLRKRVALARFYDGYIHARTNPHSFLSAAQKEKHSTNALEMNRDDDRESSRDLPVRRRGRPINLVHQHIIDLMFPSTILGNEKINTEEERAIRAEKTLNRKAASKKLLNWKANGKPWSELIACFGLGILLLLPTDLSDQK